MIQLNTSDFEIEFNNLYAISHIFVTARKKFMYFWEYLLRILNTEHFSFIFQWLAVFVVWKMSGSGRGSKKGGGGGGMPAFSDLIALGSGKSGSASGGGAGTCCYGHYKMVLFFTAYIRKAG